MTVRTATTNHQIDLADLPWPAAQRWDGTTATIEVDSAVTQNALDAAVAAADPFARPVQLEIRANRNLPSGVQAFNDSVGDKSLAAVLATRNDGYSVYIGVAQSTTNGLAEVGIGPGEGGLYSDSGLPGLTIENTTTGGYIKFQKTAVEVARFDFTGSFIPGATETYSLGNVSKVWTKLWVGEVGILYQLAVGQAAASQNVMIFAKAFSAAYAPIVGQIAANQTASALEIRSPASAKLAGFDKAARPLLTVATVPLLADLADGETVLARNAAGHLEVWSRVAGALKSGSVLVV